MGALRNEKPKRANVAGWSAAAPAGRPGDLRHRAAGAVCRRLHADGPEVQAPGRGQVAHEQRPRRNAPRLGLRNERHPGDVEVGAGVARPVAGQRRPLVAGVLGQGQVVGPLGAVHAGPNHAPGQRRPRRVAERQHLGHRGPLLQARGEGEEGDDPQGDRGLPAPRAAGAIPAPPRRRRPARAPANPAGRPGARPGGRSPAAAGAAPDGRRPRRRARPAPAPPGPTGPGSSGCGPGTRGPDRWPGCGPPRS